MELSVTSSNDPPHLQAFHHYLHGQGCGRTATEIGPQVLRHHSFLMMKKSHIPAPALDLGQDGAHFGQENRRGSGCQGLL